MRKLLFGFLFLMLGFVEAQNPIIRDQFTADPSARVFNGRMYVFPSHDIQAPEGKGLRKDWFCMEDYHVFSSENLIDWTDHGMILSQYDVPWADSTSYSMWAPDCIERNGTYYFYFPANRKPTGTNRRAGFGIGVATASHPEGPYTALPEPIAGVHGIDPNVFIDRDGQAYLYWSQGNIYVAKLKENMVELDSEPLIIANLPEKGLKEGPWVFERNGIYYLSFPHVENKTERLEYATGSSPMGPFTMKGVIMDEHASGCWTNHHSVVEYKDQWYLFYHHNDLSPQFDKNRSVRMDPLYFNPDGSIQKVVAEFAQTTTCNNPVLWADVPDMSIARNGDDFFLISTTMHLMPGAPVMTSKDLVHWEIASYVFDRIQDNSKYDLLDGTVYGRGQWASSIRYHKGMYYVLFSPNDQPFRSFIYRTKDPKSQEWELVTRTQHFHDASLFFDDDGRVFVFYGTGQLRELKEDLSDVKPGGLDMKIFERDAEETGLLEGSQFIKHNGNYYLLMISWPRNKPRRQVCYRADNITGPYEKKVILEDNFAGFPYCGQGCITDDAQGNWYGLIFQDRNGVGRVPLLMPVRWEDGWPLLGDENGDVPSTWEVPLKPYDTGKRIVESDDFSSGELKINWQWNHNPIDEAWSLIERPGFMRMKTGRVVENLYLAPNTLTQRMEGARCSGVVSLEVSHMQEGDVTGLAAFNGHSGVLSVEMEDGKKYIRYSTQIVDLHNSSKAVLGVERQQVESIELKADRLYLRLDADFNLGKDLASFYYSYDNQTWTPVGSPYKMIFDYRKLFMGSKFALFNYATKQTGGYVDVDFFHYTHKP